MSEVALEGEIKLTANIFFIFAVDAMKNKAIQFERCKEKELTQAHIYYDLCVLTQSSYTDLGDYDELLDGHKLKQQYKNAVSRFRNKTHNVVKSRYFPFNSDDVILSFDEQIKRNYASVYHKAVQFARRYFDDNASPRNVALIQKLLYYIINDESIAEDQELYINSDGSPTEKSELKKLSVIEFEAFLLGVWHYLISSQRLSTEIYSVPNIVDKLLNDRCEIQLIFKSEADAPDAGSKSKKQRNSRMRTVSDPEKIKAIKRNQTNRVVTDDVPPIDSDFYPPEIDLDTDIISILKNNDIRLSRAIFFYLLAKSIHTIHPKQNAHAVEKLFLDLLAPTLDSDCGIDFEQSHVRDYHNKFKYLKELSCADCLDNAADISAFSDKLNSNYYESLSDMINIRKKYFNSESENETLVIALIEFIRNDDSIADHQEFLVCSDGAALTKAQLCQVDEIEFEPFLLGVWHYVVSQLNTKDDADENTFDAVFKVSFRCNGEIRTLYRTGHIIEEQSEMYVELIYL